MDSSASGSVGAHALDERGLPHEPVALRSWSRARASKSAAESESCSAFRFPSLISGLFFVIRGVLGLRLGAALGFRGERASSSSSVS
jgi:hypothetical protein